MRRFLRVILAIALAVAGCAGCGSATPGTNLPPARYIEQVPHFPSLRDYRGIIDCRAGANQETRLADLARDAQIDFIFLSAPANAAGNGYGVGGFTNQILFIPGAAFPVGSRGAEIIGVGLQSSIAPGQSADALIRAIHDQNGLAIAAQPSRFASAGDYALADGIEVYNQRVVWNRQTPAMLYLRGLFLSSDHFLDDLDIRPTRNLALYDQMASGSSVTMVAGLGRSGNLSILGARVGTYRQLFRFYTTHLLAQARETAPLMAALKEGHAYISFDLLGYVGYFVFYAANGNAGSLMGDGVVLSPGLVLKCELAAPADRIALLRDGAQVASAAHASRLAFKPTTPGAYRIEAYRKGLPWIFSNPIYVH